VYWGVFTLRSYASRRQKANAGTASLAAAWLISLTTFALFKYMTHHHSPLLSGSSNCITAPERSDLESVTVMFS